MNKYVFCVAIFMCFVSANAQMNRVITTDGFKSPQAILVTNLSVFVSNLGDNLQLVKNGSGFISKLDRTGKIIDMQFIGNLNAPKGMLIIDNVIYVADIDSLKAFNLTTKKQILNFPISGVNSLNDVIQKDDNTLLVSDKETGLILSVDLKKKSYHTFATIENNLGHINNMALDKQFVYVTTFNQQISKGNILRISIKTQEIDIIREFNENISGISVLKNGGIIVASWGQNNDARLYKISKNGKIYEIDLDEEIQTPTKFYIDSLNLWIPNESENKIQKIIPEK